jgi:hypothetical protein
MGDKMMKPIHMKFYETSFLDFDMDHEGYSTALMSLIRHRQTQHIKPAMAFFGKYAKQKSHKHQALCAECLAYLKESLK